jgi:hypothetical protein
MTLPRANRQSRRPLRRMMLAAGLFIWLLAPASPQLLTSRAADGPSAADKAHMEWLVRAWSQTADSEKPNWAWSAEAWSQADPSDATSGAWLAEKLANSGESEREHWAWLGNMWARAKAAVQPGTTRGDVLKVFRSTGSSLGSNPITEQYVMRQCPFFIVTALVDTGMEGPFNAGPDLSARIEKIVRQELWPCVPLKPDAEDEQHCRQFRQQWRLSTDAEQTELSRRAKEWGSATAPGPRILPG